MEEREINKYRIDTARLKYWDYSSYGFYFVTICVKDMKCYLGVIKDEKIYLSDAGKIVKEEWEKTAILRISVTLDEFIIMPNHFHSILILDNNNISKDIKIPNWKPNSLGSVINQFKGICTRRIRGLGLKDFSWQSRYYDRIIRNEIELYNVRNYIKYNYLNWRSDEYFIK